MFAQKIVCDHCIAGKSRTSCTLNGSEAQIFDAQSYSAHRFTPSFHPTFGCKSPSPWTSCCLWDLSEVRVFSRFSFFFGLSVGGFETYSSWWFQPNWKNMLVQIASFPQLGVKIKKNTSQSYIINIIFEYDVANQTVISYNDSIYCKSNVSLKVHK